MGNLRDRSACIVQSGCLVLSFARLKNNLWDCMQVFFCQKFSSIFGQRVSLVFPKTELWIEALGVPVQTFELVGSCSDLARSRFSEDAPKLF